MVSEASKIVIQLPMSFVGSARRAWKLTRLGPSWAKVPLVLLAVLIIAVWWIVDLAWLIVFGIIMVPWRLLRRGQRKRKQEELRHQELLAARRN